jgi:glyoxylase-like metal-dependent hydrolase (beta-lactamase superfamily II)
LYVILTHRHSDYVFGMRVMEEKEALAIAHPLLKEFFQARGDRHKQFIAQSMGCSSLKAETILGDIVLSLPDRVVERRYFVEY